MKRNTYSYRMQFNLDNKQHRRIYDIIKDLPRHERATLFLLALWVLLDGLDFKLPDNGVFGLVARLVKENKELKEIPARVVVEDVAVEEHPAPATSLLSDEEPEPCRHEQLNAEDIKTSGDLASFILGTLEQFDNDME